MAVKISSLRSLRDQVRWLTEDRDRERLRRTVVEKKLSALRDALHGILVDDEDVEG